MTRPNSLPLCNLVFFWFSCFFGLLFFWFLVFWFVVGGLKGWQNNKVKDLLFASLCQFSHFRGAIVLSVDYIVCVGPVVPIENHVKTMENAGITGGSLGGLGHRLGSFVCLLCKFSRSVFNKCKNIGSQWMCRTDFDIKIVGSNP